MRYLIPATGVGRRMGGAPGGLPKCMSEIAGEPLIVRLLRQIRTIDPAADIHVVLGYRREVVPVAGHFFPREAPQKVADAVLELIAQPEGAISQESLRLQELAKNVCGTAVHSARCRRFRSARPRAPRFHRP